MAQTRAKTQARTRRGFGRLRQRSSGRWQASYIHRGALHYAAATFPTKSAGGAWLQGEQDLIDLDARQPGTWTPPADRATKAAAARLTFKGYADTWMTQRKLAPKTRNDYQSLLDHHILPVLGDFVLSAITPDDIRQWFSDLDESRETSNARAYGVVTAVLNTAVDDGLIDRSPARIKGGSIVKDTKRNVVLLTPEELVALADEMPARLRLAVFLAGWCGLRRGEVFALTRADVAPDGSAVTVNKGVIRTGRAFVSGPPKTRQSRRTVAVPTHIRPMITEHLRGHVGPTKSALLFPDPVTGEFHTEGRFRGSFFAARKAIGHDDLHFHDLRHFGGVMAALAGATTKEVMDRLGHTTTATAMRYQHVAAGRADGLADRLSALAGVPSKAPASS